MERGKIWWKYLSIIIVILLAIGGWFFSQSIEMKKDVILEKEISSEIDTQQKLIDNFSSIDELHWTHMPLTYFLTESCKTRLDGSIEQAIYDALGFVEERTGGLINFEKSLTNKSDVLFNCDIAKYEDGILAQAIPKISNNIISSGEVSVFTLDGCAGDRPTVYIHEVIHLFGIGHPTNTDSEDIMRAYRYGTEWGVNPCDNDLTERDADCLRYIYSNGEQGTNCDDVVFLK